MYSLHFWASGWFLLFYSSKPPSQVWTLISRKWSIQVSYDADFLKARFRFRLVTVNSHLADTSLLRTPCYYGQQQNPRRKLQPFDWNKLPLLRTLATTDLRTLYSVPTSQFYCFLSRYSGHRAASWNICTHIKSIFSAFWDCLCLFWSISASSVHQSKFLHLFLLRPSLQSRCHE